jgi:GAF domain-containing protein
MTPDSLDPTAAFAELGRIKLGETGLDGVLGRIADLAKRTVPGADEVSVTLVRSRGPHTAAFTGRLAVELDERQYRDGSGPCLEAAATNSVIAVGDLTREERWGPWAAQALSAGARSSLAIGLPMPEGLTGALNIYSLVAHAFDEDAVLLLETFAAYAGVALANAHLFDATVALAEHLRRAMASRAVIEQAKGIIMSERGCSSDEAFTILAKLSQDGNRKLREVASTVVTGAIGANG